MAWLLALTSVAAAAVAFLIKRKQGQEHAVYVIGDLHGDVECAKHWVNKTGLVKHGKWKDATSKLVFLGDYIDKGITSKQVVEYVKGLTENFPSQVTAIMGNHEMELLKDRTEIWGGGNAKYFQLCYASVHPAEYFNYLNGTDEQDEIVVDALYNASLEVYGKGLYRSVFFLPDEGSDHSILHFVPENIRPLVKERLQIYQAAYLDAYRSGTELGNWLEQRPVAKVIDGTMFVHGGLSPEVAQFHIKSVHDVDRLNRLLAENANEMKLNEFIRKTPEGNAVYNMLVYRGNHQKKGSSSSSSSSCGNLRDILPQGVHRLAVGHTPAGSVRLQCNDSFLALDSALSRYFRNSGNQYCSGQTTAVSSNGRFQCHKKSEQCEGQIVKIIRGRVQVIE